MKQEGEPFAGLAASHQGLIDCLTVERNHQNEAFTIFQ